MSAQANHFKLGLFVIVAVTLLCAGVIVLGAAKLFEHTVIVETSIAQSVEGISKGSAVKYRGIQLGQVADITLAALKYESDRAQPGRFGTTVLLELAIRRDSLPDRTGRDLETWLARARDAGLRARTASSGLTGPAYVEIVYLDPKEFPAPELTWTPPALYIPGAPSTTEVLISAVQGILKKLDAIDMQGVVTDADVLLKSVNTKIDELAVQKISEDVLAFVAEIRESNERIQQILNNPAIDPAIDDLRATLENAKASTARIEEVLADPRVDRLLTSMDLAGDELPPALQDFRRAVRRIDRLVETQQTTIDSALLELDRALKNIKAITDDATHNPARTLFGEPPPPVKPGAKR